MHDEANVPDVVPAPPRAETAPGTSWRAPLLLAVGAGVGLAVGVLLTVSVSLTYRFLTPTLPLTDRNPVEVFHELNELRQQINQLNEARKLQDQETVDAIRQALSTVAAASRARVSEIPGAVVPQKEPGGGTDRPPVRKANDPFADIDEEIKRLEDTQKVLNTILDMFTPKARERPKDRPGEADKGKEQAKDRSGGGDSPGGN